MSAFLDAGDEAMVAEAIAEARSAGVAETQIRQVVTQQLELGADVFAVTAICGRLGYLARACKRQPRPDSARSGTV